MFYEAKFAELEGTSILCCVHFFGNMNYECILHTLSRWYHFVKTLVMRINSLLFVQELSEYLTQPYRNRDGGGERQDSLDRRQDSSGSSIGRSLDRPHLVGKAWYYGTITRAQCDNLLNQHGHDGDFLIRDSETNVSTVFSSSSNAVEMLDKWPSYGRSPCVSDGWLLSVPEGPWAQQALPGPCGRSTVLHWSTQVPHTRSAGGSLPACSDLHQQARGETLSCTTPPKIYQQLLSVPTHVSWKDLRSNKLHVS